MRNSADVITYNLYNLQQVGIWILWASLDTCKLHKPTRKECSGTSICPMGKANIEDSMIRSQHGGLDT